MLDAEIAASMTSSHLSDAAFKWLCIHNDTLKYKKKKLINFPVEEVAPMINWKKVKARIFDAYGLERRLDLFAGFETYYERLTTEVPPLHQVIQEAKARIRSEEERVWNAEREAEFELPYLNSGYDVPEALESYLNDCWGYYKDDRFTYSPYICLLQSEGYGKSRLVRELAVRTASAPTSGLRVLYVSCREEDSNFPRRTPRLRRYFFGDELRSEDVLTDRLVALVNYALAHWDSVGTDWLRLFKATGDADTEIVNALSSSEGKVEATSTETPDTTSFKPPPQRVLVLALDDARCLVSPVNRDNVGWLARLRSAMRAANERLRIPHRHSVGIFGLFADSHSKILDPPRPDLPAVPERLHPTDQLIHKYMRLAGVDAFAPFVLSHTFDVWFDKLVANAKTQGQTAEDMYRAMVLTENPDYQWQVLAHMGRPRWCARLLHASEADLIKAAAEKLDGVAAMLCRTGLRANSWSPLAKRLVADNMATLTSVDKSQTQFASVFTSEPLLAFAAARVWYHADMTSFRATILSEFGSVLHDSDAIKMAEGVQESLVARIVLLLAMDTVGVSEEDPLAIGRGEATTQFQWVDDFLHVLHGKAAPVMASSPGAEKHLKKLLPGEMHKLVWSQWRDWKIGFTHFIEMHKEPSTDVLWALLARRAACALARRPYESGIDLLLPIFNKVTKQVSTIRVFIPRHDGDETPRIWIPSEEPGLPDAVSTHGIRVCLRLDDDFTPSRYYWFLPTARESAGDTDTPRDQDAERDPASYVLYVDGLAPWPCERPDSEPVKFLTDEVIRELAKLAMLDTSNPMEALAASHRGSARNFAKRTASTRALATSLLADKWDLCKPASECWRTSRRRHQAWKRRRTRRHRLGIIDINGVYSSLGTVNGTWDYSISL